MTTQTNAGEPHAVPPLTLGWRLKMAAEFAEVSREELAADLEVHPATITRWFKDKGAPPRTPFIRRIALRCGVSYDWLVTGIAPVGPDDAGTTKRYGQACEAHIYAWPVRAIAPLVLVAPTRQTA